MDPALTILLMAQPNVVSAVLSNTTFRGRGLTARFLYSMPVSSVGSRRYRSEAVTDGIYRAYERLVVNLLDDEYPEKPQIITLSQEADSELESFANWLEPKLTTDYAEMADWAGKLVGNVLRMVVLDELSSFKNHKSKRFRALMKVRPKVKRIIGLTGTPSSNGLMDLWAEFKVLDKGERLGRFITQYRTAYFMNQANRLWDEIFQIVKENCSTEYGGANPQDDVMERLLRARKGM